MKVAFKAQVVQLSLFAGLLLFGAAMPAEAIPFDFNSLQDNASNASVQTYMRDVLSCPTCVTVTNARGETNYDGEGHVVGPNPGNVSLTLGRSDGATQHLSTYDAFLTNAESTTQIIMDFTFPIFNVSFDYEIFPDGTCPDGRSGICGAVNQNAPKGVNWPDFKFYADNVLQFTTYAVMPGNPGAPYTHSPISGAWKTEKAPQFLGQSGTLLFPDGVNQLRFVDWPATIGVDNLRINEPGITITAVPEPGTMLLLGSGLMAIRSVRRRVHDRSRSR